MSLSDLELVEQYARNRAEDAFAMLIQRHLDLVYSAALRQVRSPQLAEEVAQSVFTDLAQNAGKLKPNTIVSGWLYQVTRRTAVDVIRRESRRQAREKLAADFFHMSTPSSEWTQIEPLLDEAMATLEETDRSAILLRYFKNQSLREVGRNLSISDDAAQKRVSRALERLRQFFGKRGIVVGSGGLALLISTNVVQAAPAGLTIKTAALLSGITVAGAAAATAAKTIAMTTLQKTCIVLTLSAAVGVGLYEKRQTFIVKSQVQSLQQQQGTLMAQLEQLARERDEATNRLAILADAIASTKDNSTELLKLRGEVALLRNLSREVASKAASPEEREVQTRMDKVKALRAWLERMPDKKIPELQLLSAPDWLGAVGPTTTLESDADFRLMFSGIRHLAKQKLVPIFQGALQQYLNANDGHLPESMSHLKPFCASPIDDAILERYSLIRKGRLQDLPADPLGIKLIAETAPVDPEYDVHYEFGLSSYSTTGVNLFWMDEVPRAISEFKKAHNGQAPTVATDLVPYLKTQIQADKLQRLFLN